MEKQNMLPVFARSRVLKNLFYTIYALSEDVNILVPNSEVSREVLLDAIRDITLASATLTVIYSRDI